MLNAKTEKTLLFRNKTGTIESRYDNIIPLLEARGAGTREFRLMDQSSYRASKKKVPWNAASNTFDASSPAADRHKPFGEPERKTQEKDEEKNYQKGIGKKKRRYPPKPVTKFVPFKKKSKRKMKSKTFLQRKRCRRCYQWNYVMMHPCAK